MISANALLGTTPIALFAGHDVAPDAHPLWAGSLEDFRDANVDWEAEEFAALLADLAAGRAHRAGGGAGAGFTVRLAPEQAA